jgi:hypothetical protein
MFLLLFGALSRAIFTILVLAILDIWSFHSIRLPRIHSFWVMCSFRTLSFNLFHVIFLNIVISVVSKAFFE